MVIAHAGCTLTVSYAVRPSGRRALVLEGRGTGTSEDMAACLERLAADGGLTGHRAQILALDDLVMRSCLSGMQRQARILHESCGPHLYVAYLSHDSAVTMITTLAREVFRAEGLSLTGCRCRTLADGLRWLDQVEPTADESDSQTAPVG